MVLSSNSMISVGLNTHYETLEVSPDASEHDIREAYLRLKAAYAKDSPAVYSMVSAEDAASILANIEEAYQVLSNAEKRRKYDLNHQANSHSGPLAQVIPLGRGAGPSAEPPMEGLTADEDLMVAPRTDIPIPAETRVAPVVAMRAATGSLSAPAPSEPIEQPIHEPVARWNVETGIDAEIDAETEWSGTFLRKAREARRVSIEELSEATKITKRYINAIEQEDFERFPAKVYLRGFLTQIARKLRLPHDRVLAAYMRRFEKKTGAPG